MNELLPEILVIVDMVGLGLTMWLGLHLVTHGWGWQRSRARQAALALWSLSLVFALAAYDSFSAVSGADPTRGLLRLMLVPLPLAWVAVTRRLAPGVIAARYGMAMILVLLLTVAAAAVNVATNQLDPAWLPHSWLFLPAYVLSLVVAAAVVLSLAGKAKASLGGALERRSMGLLPALSVMLVPAMAILTTDLTFGLEYPLFARILSGFDLETRLAGSLLLLIISLGLGRVILWQARAEGAPHLSHLTHSLLVTLAMTVLYMTVGGFAVWYWQLPKILLGIFLFLALITDWLDNATRAFMEKWLYSGATGKLRDSLRAVADRMEKPDPLPPAIRPLLSRLARQLNSPQIGLALPDPEKKGYRVAVALRPSWEGQVIDVPHPDVWEERSMGGWNKPVKAEGKTIGIIASEKTGPLNPVHVQLLDDAANEIVRLLADWQELQKRRESLQKSLDEYRGHEESLEKRFLVVSAPVSVPGNLVRGLEQALSKFNDATAVGRTSLANLRVVEQHSTQKDAESRGKILQTIIGNLIEQLRPFEGDPPTVPTEEWNSYLILSHRYLHAESEPDVMTRLYMTKRSYGRARRHAIDTVARALAELEAAMRHKETQRKASGQTGAAAGARPRWGTGGTSGAVGQSTTSPSTVSPSTTRAYSPTVGPAPASSTPAAPSAPVAASSATSPARGMLGKMTGRFQKSESPASAAAPTTDASKPSEGAKTGWLPGRSQAPKTAPENAASSTEAAKGSLTARFSNATSLFKRGKESAEKPAAGGTTEAATRIAPAVHTSGTGGSSTAQVGSGPGTAAAAPAKPLVTPPASSSGYTRAVPKPSQKEASSTPDRDDHDDPYDDSTGDF